MKTVKTQQNVKSRSVILVFVYILINVLFANDNDNDNRHSYIRLQNHLLKYFITSNYSSHLTLTITEIDDPRYNIRFILPILI